MRDDCIKESLKESTRLTDTLEAKELLQTGNSVIERYFWEGTKSP